MTEVENSKMSSSLPQTSVANPVLDASLNCHIIENGDKKNSADTTAGNPKSAIASTNQNEHITRNSMKINHPEQANGENNGGGNEARLQENGRKPKSRAASTTPTKPRSMSKDSMSSRESSDLHSSVPSSANKKVPMNKIKVGAAPSPKLDVSSKIGSLHNSKYKPGGGHVKIESKKVDFKNVAPRTSTVNDKYKPHGGEKKIPQVKLEWNAKSKIGSLENASYKPKGGDKKIETVKLDFKEKATSKVGSKENMKHVPGGGDIKIETKKVVLKVESKIGSLDNVKHKPGGGSKKIFDDKEYLRQRSRGGSEHGDTLSNSKEELLGEEQSSG